MTQKTLLYSHEDKCPANKPPKPQKLRKSQIKAITEQQQQQTEEQEPIIEQPMKKGDVISIRKEKIKQTKEKYKSLILNAF